MSATQFYVNETAHTQFVGGRMIPPGEGRDVPLMYLPATHRPEPVVVLAPEAPSLDALLADMMAHSVKHVVALLPELTHEALDRLAELEAEAAVPRKTLLAAVSAEQLRRAELSLDGAAAVAQLTDAERLAQSQAAFQAELDAQTAAQLDALSPEERAAIEGMVPAGAPVDAQSLPPAAAVADALADAPADGAQPQPEQV